MASSDIASVRAGRDSDVGVLDIRADSPQHLTRPWRILLIDDQTDLRQCVATILEEAGHMVEEAESGDAGIRTLHISPIDLVITDLQMSGLSGWDVARAARSIRPELPVIVMTGCPELLGSETEVAALFAGVLNKPFHAETLLRLIAKLTNTENMPEHLVSSN